MLLIILGSDHGPVSIDIDLHLPDALASLDTAAILHDDIQADAHDETNQRELIMDAAQLPPKEFILQLDLPPSIESNSKEGCY